MPIGIYRGNDAPLIQKQVIDWDETRGGSYSELWEGMNPAKAQAFFNGQVYTTRKAKLTVTNGMAECEFTWGASGTGGTSAASPSSLEITLDRWECPSPKTPKPLFDHPQFLADITSLLTFASLPTDDVTVAGVIAGWNNAATSGQALGDFTLNTDWANFLTANPTIANRLARFYQKVANGQTSYFGTQYSCRHTTVAPNYWSRNVADFNVDCVYSPAQFMSEVTNGFLWYLPLPGRLQYKLASAVSALISSVPDRTNYQIGWLKDPSSETTVYGGRVEIQTDYTLDQWSCPDIYGFAS